ncbi:MAG: hypothetical protein ACO1PI_05535 [Bacteroidota bacterium]
MVKTKKDVLALRPINNDRFYTCRNQTGIKAGIMTGITTVIKPAAINGANPEGF